MAGQNAPGSEAERQKLSESLSALSKQAQEMGLQLPQLDEAISALAENKTDLVLKDIEAATTDLEKMRDMAKSLQQLQQQMEKMGKDLAEQLKFGQAEMAQATLEKMVERLKSSTLSSDELKKILEEVSRAVDPASPYGKVADLLKQSCYFQPALFGNLTHLGLVSSVQRAAKNAEQLAHIVSNPVIVQNERQEKARHKFDAGFIPG